jgi:hypothetical protein
VETWDSVFIDKRRQCILSVYVDDFKLACPAQVKDQVWADISRVVKMEPPEDIGRYLGCQHVRNGNDTAHSSPFSDFFKKDAEQDSEPFSLSPPVFKAQGNLSPQPGGTKSLTYDMSSFLRQCTDRYLEAAGTTEQSLKPAKTPFLSRDELRKFPDENGTGKPVAQGALAPHAASVLMKILYAARMARPDLMRAVTQLASAITKWTEKQDAMLYRLVCYIHSTYDLVLKNYLGDPIENTRLCLFSDADFGDDEPRDTEGQRSTNGVCIALVGPKTFVLLAHSSKRQTVISYSTPEAELVAASYALRMVGLPMLTLWEAINHIRAKPTHKSGGQPSARKESGGQPPARGRFMDQGNPGENTPPSVQAEHLRLYLMEDNQATIKILQRGRSSQLGHIGRTHKVSLGWVHEVVSSSSRDAHLMYVPTEKQAADIFTKGFSDQGKWNVAIQNVGLCVLHSVLVRSHSLARPSATTTSCALSQPAHQPKTYPAHKRR